MGIHLTLGRVRSLAQWAVIVWVVVFWRLGYLSLLDPDEAHYAQLTREMLRARSWFVPLLDGNPFIDKPVLYHWLQGLFVHILGPSEWAIRLPSALASVALFATTRWAGGALFGSAVGHASAVMLATLPLTFALAGLGVFDMLYTAFLFGAVACLLVSAADNRPRLLVVGYALLTLAVMTKGPVALVLVLLWVVSAWCTRTRTPEMIGRLHIPIGLVFVALAASPWFVWMWLRFNGRFVRDYLLAGNLWYFVEPPIFSTRSSSYAFYLRTFVAAFFPWSLVTVGAALDALRVRRTLPDPARMLWLWAITVVGFFSVARFKLDYYIFPAAPACCILAAYGWHQAVETGRGVWVRYAALAIATSLIAVAAVSSVALFRINLGLTSAALALPAALALGGAALLVQVYRSGGRPPISLVVPGVTLVTVYAIVVVVGFPILEQSRPAAFLGRWIVRHSTPQTPVAIYGLDDWTASIRYYTDRPITHLDQLDEVRRFLDVSPHGYVVMLRKNYLALRGSGVDLQEVATRRAIVGNAGKYFRRQIWDRLAVVTHPEHARTLARNDSDMQ